MRKGGASRVFKSSTVGAFIFYFILSLAAGIFSGAGCALLTAGIVCCIVLPYTKWGLKILHRETGGAKGVAVDFHPRAIKDFCTGNGRAKMKHPGKDDRPSLLIQRKPLLSFASLCCRFASTGSGRQPDNIG